MTALGWVLLAVVGWILLSALTVAAWAWLGRWHNRRLFLRHAAELRDPVDAHMFRVDPKPVRQVVDPAGVGAFRRPAGTGTQEPPRPVRLPPLAGVDRPHKPKAGVGMSGLHPARAVKAWRMRRAARIDAIAARDELCQWWGALPPVDRKAVPNRRRRKVGTS